MSKYTTEVRFICETAAGLSESVGFSDVESVLEKSWDKIFSPSIPFYKEEKRAELCQKILAHYYTREIGFETVGLWKLHLNRKMKEIMPFYNEMYKTLDFKYSPLEDVDYFEHHENNDTFSETTTGSTTRESSTTGKSKDTRTDDLSEATSNSSETTGSTTDSSTVSTTVSTTGKTTDKTTSSKTSKTIRSDTPQNDLADFDAEQYLTSAEKTTDSSTQDGNGTSEGKTETSGTTSDKGSSSGTPTETGTRANTGTVKEEGTREETGTETGSRSENRDNTGTGTGDIHVWGKRGGQSYAAAIKEYREQILNVDMMVIEELGDLFMRLW